MALESIKEIREYRDSIREQIKDLDYRGNDSTYGGENEFTFKGLIGGVEALLTDISVLTGAHRKFLKISTLDERNKMIKYLAAIDNYLETPSNYIDQFNDLKILLRSFNVRSFSERQIEFEKEVEEVRKIKLDLQQELITVNEIKNEIDASKKVSGMMLKKFVVNTLRLAMS